MAENESHISRRGRVARAAPLVGLAGRTAGEAVVASLRRRVKGGDVADFHSRNADRYAEHLGHSKGVLMKAGQILSFQELGGAVGSDNQSVYQRALARLQDNAPPMPAEMAAGVIEAELGAHPDTLFAEFDPEPLGAASIGQVHAARLHDGRRVAVKVQYPGVDKAIRADLANTELLATFLQVMKGFAPGLTRIDVKSVAQEISARIGEEIDYRTEAANQTLFADGYRGHPFIRIPDVLPELSTNRVLTMELVEGKRFSEALDASVELRDQWGEVIMRFAVGSMRRLGLFHADPHPGNYLFHDDGSVTFLDFGCIKKYGTAHVQNIQESLNAAIDRDAESLVAALRKMGIMGASGGPAPSEVLTFYRLGLESLTEPQPFTYSPEYAAKVAREKFSPVGPYGEVLRALSLDPEYTMMLRIDLGMTSILGRLGLTAPWEAMRCEWDRGGPPATTLGELDAAFWGATV